MTRFGKFVLGALMPLSTVLATQTAVAGQATVAVLSYLGTTDPNLRMKGVDPKTGSPCYLTVVHSELNGSFMILEVQDSQNSVEIFESQVMRSGLQDDGSYIIHGSSSFDARIPGNNIKLGTTYEDLSMVFTKSSNLSVTAIKKTSGFSFGDPSENLKCAF